jgi:hypothetical protein
MHPDIERLIEAQRRSRHAGEHAENAARAFIDVVQGIELSDDVVTWAMMTSHDNADLDACIAAEWVQGRIEREREEATRGNPVRS